MSAVGRKRDSIWLYFDEVPQATKRLGKRAKCKTCGAEMEGQVGRMKNHHEIKCQRVVETAERGSKEFTASSHAQ